MATASDTPIDDAVPLRVAIIGAGIAGLSAALALRRFYPHPASNGTMSIDQEQQNQAPRIQITIYERASELRALGASIGLNPSGLRILCDGIGLAPLLRLDSKTGADGEKGSLAFRQPEGRPPMVYLHWRTGEEIGLDRNAAALPAGHGGGDGDGTGKRSFVEERHRMARFHRADLQRTLVDALPGDVEMKFGKKVQDVRVRKTRQDDDENAGGNAEVSFEDGSSIEADLVIGADGIHSKVRRAFAPEHEPRWTGQIAFRAVFDYSLVKDIEGLPNEAVFWVGHERTFFGSRLGNYQYAIVGSHHSNPSDPGSQYRNAKWDGPGDLKFFRSLYQGWNPVVRAIVMATPYIKMYPNHAGTALPSLVFQDQVVLLGDAAHTHGGAFAAGGSLAINDAYALARSLSSIWPPGDGEAGKRNITRQELRRALRLYDETRRPLVTRLLDLVHSNAQARRWTADKKTESSSASNETDAELRARIADRPDMRWLTEHNVDVEFEAVLARQ